MDQKCAIVWLTEDFSPNEQQKPLMLEAVLFCPILTWVGRKLKADGVRRFFIVCAPEFAAEARACFSPDDAVCVSDSRDDLLAFLKEESSVVVLPCAAVPVALDGENSAYAAPAAALREARTVERGGEVPGARTLEGFTDVHSFAQLQDLQLACRDAVVREQGAHGVSFLDPSAVYLDPRVTIGAGTAVLPGTILRGETAIGAHCEIGPNAMIRDCTIGSGSVVNASQLNESTVGDRTNVGPFAYVRPNSHIGDDIKVGDFVEVKNSTIGSGTKISHLTYVGDSDVGEHVNFGCGTVTTNYDGFKKYRCTIGNRAFLGCNTNLIAPVTIGNGAYTAAGSTITTDVPDDALAIARERETVKKGWAARRRKLHGQK